MSKWIKFDFLSTSKSGKTNVWFVLPIEETKLEAAIGIVKWYAPWRKYSFFPCSNTVFEKDCLRDIADFCENETRNKKSTK